MKVQNEIHSFYNKNHIREISTKGYYDEKISFYVENLMKLKESFSKKLKILDVACNDGYLSKIFSDYGEVLGIDINSDANEKCKKNGIKCLNKDINGLGKKYDGFFDVVIAGDIIEHVFDTDEFLMQIKRVLTKKGTLLLTTANIASFGRRLMLLMGKNPYTEYSTILPNKEFNVGHIRYYTVENMYDQLKYLKFKDIHIYGDRINLTEKIYIPRMLSKKLPNISRYMHVTAKK